MWEIIGILVVGAVIIFIEVPTLLRRKARRELWVFSILLLFGIGLSIANSLQVELPNPLDWLTTVYKPLYDILSSYLQ